MSDLHEHAQSIEHQPAAPDGRASWGDRRLIPWLIVVVCVLTPVAYYQASRLLLGIDAASYAQYGKLLLEGQRLYTEIEYDKGPLVAPFFAIPQVFVPRSISAVGFFMGLCLVAQALMFRRTFRSDALAVLACMLMITMLPMVHEDCTWPSTEVLANLFVVPLVLLTYEVAKAGNVTRNQAFWIGVLPVLALNTRQPSFLCVIAPLVVLISLRRPIAERARAAGTACLGALVAFCFILIVVALIGDVRTYLYVTFVYPSRYVNWVEWPSDPRVALLRMYFTLPIAVLSVLLFGLVLTSRYRWLAIGGLLAALAMALVPKRPYPHYYLNFFPFLALWTGIVFEQIRASAFGRRAGWVGIFVILAAVVPRASNILEEAVSNPASDRIEKIAKAIDTKAPPGATLTVWGPGGSATSLTFASTLSQANRSGWTDLLPYPICNLMLRPVEQVLQEYMDRPPDVLAVHRDAFNVAQGPRDPKSFRNDIKLLQSLTDQYRYTQRGITDSFHILVRDRTRPRADPSAPAN